jgi:hypothetical protein
VPDKGQIQGQIQDRIASVVGGVDAEVETLGSGAVTITLRRSGRTVAIDGSADGREWGVSVVRAGDNPFVGHDNAAASLDEALALARDLLTVPSV